MEASRPSRGAYYHGRLPHIDFAGLTQFVTFRLADALPARAGPHESPASVEAALDRSHGACVLREGSAADIVRVALHHFNGQRYDLGPWVIMPNHVHVLLRPRAGHPLGDIVRSWKSFTAVRAREPRESGAGFACRELDVRQRARGRGLRRGAPG